MNPDEQNLSDSELVRETQAGSLEAFDVLIRRYEKRLYAFLRNCCRNETDARELTQETFVKAFQALAQFNPRHSFASWLFAIARNKCIDRHRAAPPASDEPRAPDLADEEDPARLAARSESSRTAWQWARDLLPQPQYQALWLKYAQDMSVAEIARVLRKTRIHVKVILFRGRQRLGQALRVAAGPDESLSEAWERVLAGQTHPNSPGSPGTNNSPQGTPQKGALALRHEAPGGTL